MENNSKKEFQKESSPLGVILMTYGSATTASGVKAYMEHVYRGNVPEGLVEDFEERFRLVGRSPLIDITKEQAALLEKQLNDAVAPDDERKSGHKDYIVRAAMLHSAPFIEDIVLDLKNAGAASLRGIILSPQFSSFIMDGYSAALAGAAMKHGFAKESVSVAGPWPTEPHFIKLLAARIKGSLQKLQKQYGKKVPVLFTTHSLPKRVVDKDPNYLKELEKTIDAVLVEMNMPHLEWYACYQSAGHTPEEWLKPDLTDILATLRGSNETAALIAPIQFLADHLEILYDLDIAAKAQFKERGVAYHRIELPNTDPLFIDALTAIASAE